MGRTAALVAGWILTMAWAAGYPRAAAAPQPPAGGWSPSAPQYRAVLDKYCVTCHNERLRTAGLLLDKASLENLGEGAPVWEAVVRKLRSATMPPAGSPRPDKPTYDAFVSWLETGLDRAATAAPNPGRPPALHRLNRAEYRNAIRDLLAVDVDVTSLLPADDASYGFDNIADGVVSPTLVERYLAAARKISRLAVGSPAFPLDVQTYRLAADLTQNDHLEGLPFGTRGGTRIRHLFPLDAEYEFRIRVTPAPPARGSMEAGPQAAHPVEVSVDGERVRLLTFSEDDKEASARLRNLGDDGGDIFEFRLPVRAGQRSLAVTFLKMPSVEVESLRQPFLSDRSPFLPSLDSIEIRGPYEGARPVDTPSRRRVFVCRPLTGSDEARCAKQILATLARRGYRRPVTDADLRDLLPLYEAGTRNGGFEAGIEMALRRLLVSPSFLFRIERDPANVAPGAAYRIGDLELASRLSFFLWSSIPDEELVNLATRGRLQEPAVLRQQVQRMLADPKAEALVSNFAGQWLYLRNLPSAKPEHRLFPEFDENLRQAMRRETELLFESILRENRSVMDLLTADYTFVNERLARHYGIPHVYGDHFRRVRTDENRRGLLGHGSLLVATSQPTRTSPVSRGKWILENILAAPPPPPPPNVPELTESTPDGAALSMRERMVQHRKNPACAGCHVRMDPLGLALENFDAVGRWRTRSDANEPIDASGAMPDGTPFEGPAGLRQALLRHSEDFARTVTEKLLTYASGRGLEYYDAPAVRKITRDAAGSGYGLASLVMGVVQSTPFQMRRAADAAQPAGVVASGR